MNIGGYLSDFARWVLSLVAKAFGAVWDLFTDLFINLADLVLSAFGALIVAIPAPSFLTSASLQTAFSQMSGDVLYFLTVFQIGPGIALLGSAFGFRMLRKVATLFQW